MQIKME